MRSGIRVLVRVNEDTIGNPSPGVFDLDANLLRSNLPLFLFMVESLDRNMVEQRWRSQLGGEKKEIEDQGQGVPAVFIARSYRTRLVGILDTSGICGLADLFPNFIYLILIHFYIIS